MNATDIMMLRHEAIATAAAHEGEVNKCREEIETGKAYQAHLEQKVSDLAEIANAWELEATQLRAKLDTYLGIINEEKAERAMLRAKLDTCTAWIDPVGR